MTARDDYPKLNYETFGPHHQGGTSREGQAALDEIDNLRMKVAALDLFKLVAWGNQVLLQCKECDWSDFIDAQYIVHRAQTHRQESHGD